MLDSDLAELYGVQTKVPNQAVRRNVQRFPREFMFQLTGDEHEALRSQTVTLKPGRGQHRKYAPYVFTEQGVAMLSSVLNSERAIAVNVMIMRTFVRLRELMAKHQELAAKLADLEQRVDRHDHRFQSVFEAIRQLLEPPTSAQKSRRIGFMTAI